MSTVNVPGLGAVDKRAVVVVGVGTVGAIGYILWRRQGAAAGGDEIVPADEGDLTNLGEYGGGAAWQYTTTPTGTVTSGTEGIPRTNAEWGQMALDALEGAGYDRTAAAAAIGAYQGREKLSAAEAIMIRAALGLVGRPPSGDFPVMVGATTPSTPKPTTPKPTTPATGAKPAAPSGVRASNVTPSTATITWSAVRGATGYHVYRSDGAHTQTASTNIILHGMRPGTSYKVQVQAYNAAGNSGRNMTMVRTPPRK